MNGRYLSEHLSTNDRKLHKAIKIREKLGQREGGIMAPFPSKPKGMHWQTYNKIRYIAQEIEHEILLKVQPELS